MTLVLALAVPAHSLGASGSQLSISAASSSVANGSNVNFNVMLNAGSSTVNAVQTVVTFPPQFTYVSVVAGAFPTGFTSSVSGNNIKLMGGSTTALTGNQAVATVTLRAANTGNASVSLANVCTGTASSTCSAAIDAGSHKNDLASIANTNVTVGSGQGALASNLVISDIKVSNVTAASATVTWQTNVPSISVVKYGLSDKYGLVTQDSKLVTSHSITLGGPNITRGATYYFEVTSNDAANNSATQAGQPFSTPGYAITIQVTDKSGKPLANAVVTIAGHSATTDKDGKVVFANVPAGNQQVTIKSGSKTTMSNVKVGVLNPKTHTYAPQLFRLAAASGVNWLMVLAVIVFAVVLILGSLSIAPFHIPGINPMRHPHDNLATEAAPASHVPQPGDSISPTDKK